MRAVIYARYSTDLQSASSIDDQVRLCRERLERDGHELMQVYNDRAVSGASLMRPGIQLLMQDATRGAFDLVYAEALDRISRDQEDRRIFQTDALRRCDDHDLRRSRDQRASCRLERNDERSVPKGPRPEDAARASGSVLQGLSGGGLCYGYNLLPGERGVRRINEARPRL